MKITQTGKKESKQHKKPRNNENKATDDVEDEKNAKKSQDARHELAYPPPPHTRICIQTYAADSGEECKPMNARESAVEWEATDTQDRARERKRAFVVVAIAFLWVTVATHVVIVFVVAVLRP